ncbi:MAG: type 1 glutamine amidotransferase [Phycisphaeraceae bacterium]
MAILVVEHHASEHPAQLGSILRDHGHRLRVVELHAGDPLPPDLDDIDGIISLGGPMNVTDAEKHPWMAREMELLRQAHEAGIPIVGVCLGAQMIAAALGGTVAAMDQAEIGWHPVRLAFPGTIDPLMAGIPWNARQFHLHGQAVTDLPPGATPLAGSAMCRVQAFKVGLKTYGFQYHFEWTRDDIERVLSRHADWIRAGGADADALRRDMDLHYDTYRHLGDRQIANFADLLFALEKRLGGQRGAIGNWHGSVS